MGPEIVDSDISSTFTHPGKFEKATRSTRSVAGFLLLYIDMGSYRPLIDPLLNGILSFKRDMWCLPVHGVREMGSSPYRDTKLSFFRVMG